MKRTHPKSVSDIRRSLVRSTQRKKQRLPRPDEEAPIAKPVSLAAQTAAAEAARGAREVHARTALHRSAENIASDFVDESSVLRVDDSAEMRALLAAAGMGPPPGSSSPGAASSHAAPFGSERSISVPAAWPRGQDSGALWKANQARQKFLALTPLTPLWRVQREGIAFIQRAEHTRPRAYAGGIIADDMGTGKTLQFLVFLLEEHQAQCRSTGSPYGKPTLVIVEKGLVATLRTEMGKHFAGDAFGSVGYLVGEASDTRDMTPERVHTCFRIVITTYPILVAAFKRHEGTSDARSRALFGTLWQRVLADEAHVASNRLSTRFKALCALKAHFRWAQTGTPVLNDVNSVCALLHFVGGNEAAADVPLDMTARVERVAGTAVAARAAQEQNARLELSVRNLLHVRAILADVMLRRMQPSDDHVQTTRLVDFETQGERELYAHYYAKFCADSRVITEAGAVADKETEMSDDEGTPASMVAEIEEELEEGEIRDAPVSSAMHMVSVDILRLRQLCAAPTVIRRLELPPRLLLDSGYRAEQQKAANTDARILGQLPAGVPSLAYLAAARILLQQDPVAAARLHEPNASATIDTDADYTEVAVRASQALPALWEATPHAKRQRLRAILRHLRGRIVPSIGTKMRMFARHYLHEVPRDDKFIIFSDWVSVLEHAQRTLAAVGLHGLLLTGDHKPNERTAILRKLEHDTSARALLGSMQVVANGLNIGCANHVTIVAQWWNPQTTKQGQYRVRRPGQTKACFDYNVIIRGTVEEDVRRMADEKNYIARILLENDPETCALVDELASHKKRAPEVVGASQRDMIRMLLRTAKPV